MFPICPSSRPGHRSPESSSLWLGYHDRFIPLVKALTSSTRSWLGTPSRKLDGPATCASYRPIQRFSYCKVSNMITSIIYPYSHHWHHAFVRIQFDRKHLLLRIIKINPAAYINRVKCFNKCTSPHPHPLALTGSTIRNAFHSANHSRHVRTTQHLCLCQSH